MKFLERVSLRQRLIFWGVLLGPLIVLFTVGPMFWGFKPIPPETVFGCYRAPGAPSLRVGPGKIEIGEPERRSFTYVAEPDKEGYRLSVAPALNLRPRSDGGYAFHEERGIGYFWDLLAGVSGAPAKLKNPRDFGGRFAIVAGDGAEIIYARSTNPQACR